MGFHKQGLTVLKDVSNSDRGERRIRLGKGMEAKQPRGIKAWLQHIQQVELPILKSSVRTLNKQIKAGASLANLAYTIERDPALCLHLFLAANKASHEANPNLETDILGINHVMTILGMQGLVQVVKGLPSIKLNPRSAYQKAYLQAQSDSLFAAHLAQQWAQRGQFGDGDKLKWSTLLAGAPSWAMWQGAYAEMRQLEWYRYRQHTPRRQAEAKLFGCYLEDIERMLGRHFNLPSISQQSLESAELPSLAQWAQILSDRHLDFFDDDIALKQLKRKPTVLMALVRSLAKEASLGWQRHHTQRIERAMGHLMHQPLDRLSAQLHQQAVMFSHEFAVPYVVLPAQSLLWAEQPLPWLRPPYTCIYERPEVAEPAAQQQAAAVEDTESNARAPVPQGPRLAINTGEMQPPREVNIDLLQELIKRFRSQSADFSDVHDILLNCNKAINEGLGMRQTVIFVADKTGQALRPVYSVGIDKDSPLRAVKIVLDENRFFAKLMAKTAALKIDPGNYHQAKNMMTEEVLTKLGSQNFMAMSLFANGKAIGIVYADTDANEDEISDKEYQAFKQICQAAGFALDLYAKKRKK